MKMMQKFERISEKIDIFGEPVGINFKGKA